MHAEALPLKLAHDAVPQLGDVADFTPSTLMLSEYGSSTGPELREGSGQAPRATLSSGTAARRSISRWTRWTSQKLQLHPIGSTTRQG